MSDNAMTRRKMLRQTAFCCGIAWAASLPLASGAAEKRASGIKIGAVDWELTRPADPAALTVAAKLGFDGLQVDLGDVEGMKKPDMQNRYEQLTRKHRIQIASLALGKLSERPYGADPKGQVLVDAAIDVAQAMKQRILLLAFFGNNGLDKE